VTKPTFRAFLGMVLVACAPAAALAQGGAVDLSHASLEDLLNIQITSAARKEQRVADTAAAVYVVTRDDIRRSGMTTLPDVLRLVPGVQVAQINDNKWAVTIRGFNSLFSNKLLVLVDGRTIYNHLFSGVFWDAEDLLLEDVERIEVIRGAGGALWGANAVNGVINIVTTSAAKTQGTFLQAGSGTSEPGTAAIRYGGAANGVNFRLNSQWSSRGPSIRPSGQVPPDSMGRLATGGRIDWESPRDAIVVTGESVVARAHALWLTPTIAPQPDPTVALTAGSDMKGGALMGRWIRTLESGASMQMQATSDVAARTEPVAAYHRQSADVELQYHTAVGTRNDLVAGTGFRYVDESFHGSYGFSLTPEQSDEHRFDLFAQDSLALASDRVTLTAGGRVERDNEVGWSVQPSVRAIWAITPEAHRVWAAVSRAIHTPSLQDRYLEVDYPAQNVGGPLPVATTVLGNPGLRPETMTGTDFGYRFSTAALQFDVAAFFSRYDDLRTSEPGVPQIAFGSTGPVVVVPVQFQNFMRADTSGVEVSGRWQATSSWRVDGGVTTFHVASRTNPVSADPTSSGFDANAPAAQWQLHSQGTVGRKFDIDLFLLHVQALAQLGVPAYTRADARLGWPLTRTLTLAVSGQNLFDRSHLEFGTGPVQLVATEVPRSASVALTWRLR